MLRGLTQAEIDRLAAEGARELRASRAVAGPSTVNIQEALQLGAPLTFYWQGAEYRARPISYRDGLQLERAKLYLEPAQPATTVEEKEDEEAALVEILELFRSLLDP